MILVNKPNLKMASASTNPLVSVIMNCHNGEQYLRESIDSVFAQTYSNFEIIFWDNASTDQSAAIAKSYADPRMRYFSSEQKVPLGQARNFAIAKASGELIAFLDCDDLWLPEKTAKQVPLFANPKIGLVYSDAWFFNTRTQRRLYKTVTPRRGVCFVELLNDYFLSMESVIVRRSALEALSVWFAADFNYIEEYDLFVRLGLDWELDYVAEPLAKWRVHGDSLSWRFPDGFIQERRLMLDRLQQSPVVVNQYYAALREAWSTQIVREALVEWRRNQSRRARAVICRSGNWTWKHFVVYFTSFIPWSVANRVRTWFKSSILPSNS